MLCNKGCQVVDLAPSEQPIGGLLFFYYFPWYNTQMPVSVDDFKKFELKIAEIESVSPHPNADRLYVLNLKVGEVKKTIVAGIREFYGEEELKGKKIVIVDNLEPAVIRGVESQGMLLAASAEGVLSLVTPERPIPDGARVG